MVERGLLSTQRLSSKGIEEWCGVCGIALAGEGKQRQSGTGIDPQSLIQAVNRDQETGPTDWVNRGQRTARAENGDNRKHENLFPAVVLCPLLTTVNAANLRTP